jgi:hypothetical protein
MSSTADAGSCAFASTFGPYCIQLMQVSSQTSTSTTLPRSPSGVSGAVFTHRSALSAGSRLAAPARHEPATSAGDDERQDGSHKEQVDAKRVFIPVTVSVAIAGYSRDIVGSPRASLGAPPLTPAQAAPRR